MKLEGSCHCGAVKFSVTATKATPYQRCYCSICRKTQGGGGYAINLFARAKSMKVDGAAAIAVYHARVRNPGRREQIGTSGRHFCRLCGSALWIFDPGWPDLIHPFASAIDTELPVPARRNHMMLDFKANWVEVDQHPKDRLFARYP